MEDIRDIRTGLGRKDFYDKNGNHTVLGEWYFAPKLERGDIGSSCSSEICFIPNERDSPTEEEIEMAQMIDIWNKEAELDASKSKSLGPISILKNMKEASKVEPRETVFTPDSEGTGIKKSNAWIDHVKSYAKKHNMKYFDALKDPKCKASYKK